MIIEPCSMSGELSSSTQVTSRTSLLNAVDILPPATGNVILKIYDTNSGSATGTIVFETQVAAGVSASNFLALNRYAHQGLYAVLSGTYTGTVLFNIGYLPQ